MKKKHRICPRCKEPQAHLIKDLCHACQNETGSARWWGGTPRAKTGGWADVHERRY